MDVEYDARGSVYQVSDTAASSLFYEQREKVELNVLT